MYILSVIFCFMLMPVIRKANARLPFRDVWFLAPRSRGHYLVWALISFVPYFNLLYSVFVVVISLTSNRNAMGWFEVKL